MKGVYALVLSLTRNIVIRVGALGNIRFEKGMYAYVGSAQNNLAKRIERHLTKVKRNFWHIDYLLESSHTLVIGKFATESKKSEECRIARELDKRGSAIKHFGCSDCDCPSHLFKIDNFDFLEQTMSSFP
jgi:Uri superfamily endonuclease